MSSSTVATTGKIPKPEMRRLFQTSARNALVGAFITSISSVLLWKTLVVDVKKRKYAEFYANYDPVKEEQRLIDCGVYTCIGK